MSPDISLRQASSRRNPSPSRPVSDLFPTLHPPSPLGFPGPVPSDSRRHTLSPTSTPCRIYTARLRLRVVPGCWTTFWPLLRAIKLSCTQRLPSPENKPHQSAPGHAMRHLTLTTTLTWRSLTPPRTYLPSSNPYLHRLPTFPPTPIQPRPPHHHHLDSHSTRPIPACPYPTPSRSRLPTTTCPTTAITTDLRPTRPACHTGQSGHAGLSTNSRPAGAVDHVPKQSRSSRTLLTSPGFPSPCSQYGRRGSAGRDRDAARPARQYRAAGAVDTRVACCPSSLFYFSCAAACCEPHEPQPKIRGQPYRHTSS